MDFCSTFNKIHPCKSSFFWIYRAFLERKKGIFLEDKQYSTLIIN